jgi:hypothetical protein
MMLVVLKKIPNESNTDHLRKHWISFVFDVKIVRNFGRIHKIQLLVGFYLQQGGKAGVLHGGTDTM